MLHCLEYKKYQKIFLQKSRTLLESFAFFIYRQEESKRSSKSRFSHKWETILLVPKVQYQVQQVIANF